MDKSAFEKMKDEYYRLCGRDVESGFQTISKLKELDLRDVADSLKDKGLVR